MQNNNSPSSRTNEYIDMLSDIKIHATRGNGFAYEAFHANLSKPIEQQAMLSKRQTGHLSISNDNCRFFRINELSAQEQFFLRQDLENVFAGFTDKQFSLVYFVSGKPEGIEIYIGVFSNDKDADVYNYAELLKSQLNGNISGIKLEGLTSEQLESNVLSPLKASNYFGVVTGVPSLTLDQQAQSTGKSINQGVDRLARTLVNEEWQLLIVAQPTNINDVQVYIDDVMELASNLQSEVKYSEQLGGNTGISSTVTEGTTEGDSTSTQDSISSSKSIQKGTSSGINTTKTKTAGSSTTENTSCSSDGMSKSDSIAESSNEGNNYSETTSSSKNNGITKGTSSSKSETIAKGESSANSQTISKEYTNKKIERITKYIDEKLLQRLELGRANGLFKTAIYLSSKKKTTYERLSSAFTGIFQGNQSYFMPLIVRKIHINKKDVDSLFDILWVNAKADKDVCLVQSIPFENNKKFYATWLNSTELSLLAGLPTREVCGIRLRKNIDFAANPLNPVDGFELGKVILNGTQLNSSNVQLDKKILNQHVFICGVTGSGKTTTCQQMLLKSGLPFMVIEPAKTEYRSLYTVDDSIQYFTLNNEDISPFRFNPFELLKSEKLLSHIDILKATFAAVFPMEASMPYLIEEAIVRSYESKGWDIHTTQNFLYEDPWNCHGAAFPIISEMLEQLDKVIESKGFGLDLQEKYRGSLISRLDNLTVGSKGKMFNTRRSVNIESLLRQKVVIELDELKDEQDKALVMGLLIGRAAEAIKHIHQQDHNFQHITLIEEAHRLLERPEPHEGGAKKMGVSLFANLLAEVRKYGEGLIIADQIPNKLATEVLKNTNTKIIHRLFAADDRKVMGDTVGLIDEQADFLPMLNAGEAIVYSAGWHGAVRMQVNQINDTNAKVLDESVIKQHSQKRIFQHRHELYPALSSMNQFDNADEFCKFIGEGSHILSMWVKWFEFQASKANSNSQKVLVNNMMTKLDNFYKNWEKYEEVDFLLAALFEDIAPIPYAEEKLSSDKGIKESILLLFNLYHHNKLEEKFTNSTDLGEGENNRKFTKVLANLLTSIKTI